MLNSYEPSAVNNRMAMIDCCRGVAALLVVFYHAAGTVARDKYFELDPLRGVLSFGGRGVDFFFVLSGFIIAYVHWFDLGDKTRISSYLIKRFIRVYPIHWVVAIPLLLANVLWSSERIPSAWTERAEVSIGSLALLPTGHAPVPFVVWTLKHEAFFYLLFIIVLWRPRIGTAVLASWGALCIYHATVGFKSNFIVDFVLSPYNLEFLLGVCCGCFMRLKGVRCPVAMSLVGAASFLAAGIFYELVPDQRPWIVNGTSAWQVAQFGLSSALMILGLSQIDLHRSVLPPRWLILIGAASYSIYLIHSSAIGISCKSLKVASVYVGVTPLQAFLAVGVAGVAAGICLHLCVEAPLLRVVRQALLPAKRPAARRSELLPRASEPNATA